MRRAPGCARPPRFQHRDAAHYPVAAVQVNDIDDLSHEGGVDAAASGQQQGFVKRQRRREHQAAQAGGEIAGNAEGE